MTSLNTAQFYFEELEKYLVLPTLTVHQRYALAYRLWMNLLHEATENADIGFSGAFSRLHFLCTQRHVSNKDYCRLNDLRIRMFKAAEIDPQQLTRQLPFDFKLLIFFFARIKQADIPPKLTALLPKQDGDFTKKTTHDGRCLRVIVVEKKQEYLTVIAAEHQKSIPRKLALLSPETQYDHRYLHELVAPGTQLNLIFPKWKEEQWEAELIIVEPDYLINVTSVASCFREYGVSTDFYFLQRLLPPPQSASILLGNLASQFLDEAVHGMSSSYADSLHHFFKHNALQFVATPDLTKTEHRKAFHENAASQQNNIQDIVKQQFATTLHLTRSHNILLEPSFFCEMLGLQGRIDLMTKDGHVVIEQKSGKKALFHNAPAESHRIQMLLYMAILHYAHRVPYSELHPYLLYSKYSGAQGLIRIQNTPQLLYQALKIRNELAARELLCSTTEGENFFEKIHIDQLHTRECGRLWEAYARPQWAAILDTIRSASQIERAYFYRFYRFLALEQRLSKLGSDHRETGGMAAAWLSSFDEKQQAGSIIAPLRLETTAYEKDEYGRIIAVRLHQLGSTTDAPSMTPNFRVGDIVVFYPYRQSQNPDLRRGIVFRATIKSINPESLCLRLRAPQTDPCIFENLDADVWAIEVDFMEATAGTLYRGLYSFLIAPRERRALLTGTRQARVDLRRHRCTDFQNENINSLVEKVQQAQDLFLLVGPPGTGKTSVGLISILKEEQLSPSNSILLCAFTNRAVDEICSKLVKEGHDFIRIGNEVSCDERYHSYLVEHKTSSIRRLDKVQTFIRDSRIIVGTVAALAAQQAIFVLKRFSLAIIDEASQLLEPHLLPLFAAQHEGNVAIDRFVLIGDHKQLPAVVQQSSRESQVTDPLLRKIGITNCRRSLFERLMASLPSSCIHHFWKQGRMHPEVADFANRHFYGGLLTPIPLVHQQASDIHPRVAFFHCPPQEDVTYSPKTNPAEARLIAHLCVALYESYLHEERLFDLNTTLGVIVPYRHQITLIRQALFASPHPFLTGISIDTVERFQGSEREVIIYGFTISSPTQFDFLCNAQFTDETGILIDRKLNVVLTRARCRTLLVGNKDLLRNIPLFAALIDETHSMPSTTTLTRPTSTAPHI